MIPDNNNNGEYHYVTFNVLFYSVGVCTKQELKVDLFHISQHVHDIAV